MNNDKLKLVYHLYDDLDTLISQAEMTSKQAKNTEEDLYKFTTDFLEYYHEEGTKNFIFWSLMDEYIAKKYKRTKHLERVLESTLPRYRMVYQLVASGEVIYVGKTDDFHKRLNSHSKTKVFDSVMVALCKNSYEQDCIENKLIDELRPKLNKGLNLELARQCVQIPQFVDSRDLQLDFVTPSSSRFAIPTTNHILTLFGYFSKDKFKNKPHWFK